MKSSLNIFLIFIFIAVFSSCHLIKGTTLHYGIVKNEANVSALYHRQNHVAVKEKIIPKILKPVLLKSTAEAKSAVLQTTKFSFTKGFSDNIPPKKLLMKRNHPRKKRDYVLLRGCYGCTPPFLIAAGAILLYFATENLAFSIIWMLFVALIAALLIGLFVHFFNRINSEKYLRNKQNI